MQIIYWDEQSLFMEHRFVRPSDQFIHCIVICRQRVIDVSMEAVMAELLPLQTSATPLQASRHTLSSTASLQPVGIAHTVIPVPAAMVEAAAAAVQAENGHVAITIAATATATATTTTTSTTPMTATATATATTLTAKLRPPLPPELARWIEYNEMSSKNLRSGCWPIGEASEESNQRSSERSSG